MEKFGIGKPIEILLVEDSPGDVRLVQENMKEAKMLNLLHVVSDGVEAMEYLRKQGKYKDAVRPDLVLLDLNLPKKDGREVLAEMKTDKELMSIPVVVLTISKAEEDILKSYNLHANAFITKPVDLNKFLKVTKAIDDFWLTVVSLPQAGK
jgi:CheY-like chemotaxis protein